MAKMTDTQRHQRRVAREAGRETMKNIQLAIDCQRTADVLSDISRHDAQVRLADEFTDDAVKSVRWAYRIATASIEVTQ